MSRTASYVLSSHPLKRWIDAVLLADFKQPQKNQSTVKKTTPKRRLSKARRFIIDKLGIDEMQNLTKEIIKERLEILRQSQELEQFINSVKQQLSLNDNAVKILLEVYSELPPEGDK